MGSNTESKVAALVTMLRDEDFTFVGLCADGSVRVGHRGTWPSARQFPASHPRHAEIVALASIVDPEAFESAVMGVI